MHNVFSNGVTTIWWNASATFRVYYAERELLAFTHYNIDTLAQAQAAAKHWYWHGGGETVAEYLMHA